MDQSLLDHGPQTDAPGIIHEWGGPSAKLMSITTTRPLQLVVSGSAADNDAPTVEDLLGQLQDFVTVLHDVERAIARENEGEIEWRVTNARRSSPLALEITPFPKSFGMNIDRMAAEVRGHTARGLATLRQTGERPTYFSDDALASAIRLFQRVTNGLATTRIDFGEGLPPVDLTSETARLATVSISRALGPAQRPYHEIGSVEGYFGSLKRDKRDRPLLYIRARATGETVRCIVRGAALREVERHQIGDMWKPGRRIVVIGLIHFKGPGRIEEVIATDVRLLRDRSELPKVDDIVDRDFTGGLSSEAYLEELRGGERP